MPPLRVLVVARDATMREQVRQLLVLAGHTARGAASIDDGACALRSETHDVALIDVAPGEPTDVSPLVSATAHTPVSLLAIAADHAAASAALRQGAHGWLARPFDAGTALAALERAGAEARRARELEQLRGLLGGQGESVLLGRSPVMQRLRELVQRAAASRAAVIVSGEPGTGKELVARTIHALSAQAHGPCVLVECAGRDAAALEAELFGVHGAVARGAGGTVIVDDATALPAFLQGRLLRGIQERVSSGAELPRLIVTVREERRPEAGPPAPRFDLLARAGTLAINVPPLRDRRSDIPLLAAHFRNRFGRDAGVEPPPFSADVVGTLLGHDWPGNVRQLEHYVARLMLMPAGARAPLDAPTPSPAAQAAPASIVEAAHAADWSLEDLEREYIHRVLDEERGHQSRAAQRLGIDRRTLYRKLRQYRAQESARRAPPRPVMPSARARTA